MRSDLRAEGVEPIRASELRQKPVVSMAGGVKVGTVADLAIDARDLRVFGLVVAGPDGQAVVPMTEIERIGPDAITIDSADGVARPAADQAAHGLSGLRDLVGLPVVDGEGVVLGRLAELELDRRDGRVTGLVAREGGVLGLGGTTVWVDAERVRSLGPRIVTVAGPPA
jgi:sporulation protein YlmC with PRC-barrel domain